MPCSPPPQRVDSPTLTVGLPILLFLFLRSGHVASSSPLLENVVTRWLPLILAGFLAIGCGGSEQQNGKANDNNVAGYRIPPIKPGEETTLRINIGAEPRTLDPSLITDLVASMVIKSMMETLVTADVDGNIEPKAAESWEHDPDYKVWTFKLRRNARWHNGDPVTAGDFVYAAQRLLTPSLGAQYATYVMGFVEGADEYYAAGGMDGSATLPGIIAIDDYTLQYRLKNPTPFFLSVVQLFSWLPLHRPTIEKHGERWANSPETFVGNGPFRLTGYRTRDVITVERATTYWGPETIFWSKILFYMIENETTESSAFVAGQLDVTSNVPIPELEIWKERPEYRPYRFFGTYYINVNHDRPPFNDPRVRKAFSLSINRDVLANRVTRRGELVAEGIVARPLDSPRGGDYREHAGDFVGGYDPQKAKALLQEAGFGPGGKPFPSFEYIYNTSEENRAIAEQLQAMWRANLGVDVRLQNVEFGVRLSRAQGGDYDLSLGGWYGDYLDPMTFLELFTSDSTFNVARYRSDFYDDHISRARTEGDALVREDLLIAAERRLIADDMAIIPLYYYTKPILVRTDIEGVGREVTAGLVYVNGRRVSK